MTTEMLSERRDGDRRHGRGQWFRRGLPAVGTVIAVGLAAALMTGSGPMGNGAVIATETVKRGEVIVTITEEGVLESSNNTEIRCQVRGMSTVTWVIESGTEVQAGDELVRLDPLALEETISERTKYSHWSRSSAERSAANIVRARMAIPEYLEGRYVTELKTLKKDLAIAMSNQRTAQNFLSHAKEMSDRGYVSDLEMEETEFALTRAQLSAAIAQRQIEVLDEFTKEMELVTLRGDLDATIARHAANVERAKMDEERRALAAKELGYCVIKAEQAGLVIHPSAAVWKEAPEIEEGATVYNTQTLLLMPDLTQMQVEIGVHESIIERMKVGLAAKVTLAGRVLDGEVVSVSPVARPAGWWRGSVVKYDTVVKLASVEGLKPGMSAEVEVALAHHENVPTIPVDAVVDTPEGTFCWVQTGDGIVRRDVRVGDTDGEAVVVKSGLAEGEEIVVDPLACIAEAQAMATMPHDYETAGEASEGGRL